MGAMSGDNRGVNAAMQRVAREFSLAVKAQIEAIGLGGSDLDRSITTEADPPDAVVLTANYYAEYVISGRRPGARKVPIDALLKWVKAKGIQAQSGKGRRGGVMRDTQLAFAIQNAIYKRGIASKDFVTPSVAVVEPKAVEAILAGIYEDWDKSLREAFA
jgi:hypothetical protein